MRVVMGVPGGVRMNGRRRPRNLLDFHVDDWHPDFLSRFDPVQFADGVLSLRSTAATVFANTHTGLSNYPTTTGEMHAGLHGRDALGATIDELHRRGIDVVVYYVRSSPTGTGTTTRGTHGRRQWGRPEGHRHVRRQAPALQHHLSQRARLSAVRGGPDRGDLRPLRVRGRLAGHDLLAHGLLLRVLRSRYRSEVGGEIPRVIDWTDPVWVGFQRKRQEWLVEFGQLVTDTFKRRKPGISVAHQSLAFHSSWLAGGSDALAGDGLVVRRPVRRAVRPVVLRQAVLRSVEHPALRAHQHAGAGPTSTSMSSPARRTTCG